MAAGERVEISIEGNTQDFRQSLTQARQFARDTGVRIDQELQSKLEVQVASARQRLD